MTGVLSKYSKYIGHTPTVVIIPITGVSHKYFSDLFVQRESFALAFRKDMFRENHTNNFCEVQFRVLKDKVLNRTKGLNAVPLFETLDQ